MANLFLPKIATWFRLDEHVRRLKEFVDSLTTRIEVLEDAPPGGSELPYKVYTALLNQSGTDAPVATVLENTLGITPIWSYRAEGIYETQNLGLWIDDGAASETVFITGGYFQTISAFFGGAPNEGERFAEIYLENGAIVVASKIHLFTNATLSYSDNILYYTPIEIKVYS